MSRRVAMVLVALGAAAGLSPLAFPRPSPGATKVWHPHWWAGFAFANARSGALLEGVTLRPGSCVLYLTTTMSGGKTWQKPIVLSRRASCDRETSDPVAMTGGGAWFVGLDGGIYHGTSGSRHVARTASSTISPQLRDEIVCSLSVSGQGAVALFATSCAPGLGGAARKGISLVVLAPNGAIEHVLPRPPLPVPAGSGTGALVPEDLAASMTSIAVVGWRTAPLERDGEVKATLVVARHRAGSRAWSKVALPCPSELRQGALLASTTKGYAAACLGTQTAGAEGIAVVTSQGPGGAFSLSCVEPSPFTARSDRRGDCPKAGYATSLATTGTGALVVALSSRGTVAVSHDGGRSWHTSLVLDSGEVFVGSAAGDVFALASGPVGTNALYRSANGSSWTSVPLPKTP